MEAKETQDEAIINDCKNLGEDIDFYKNEIPKMHFECKKTRWSADGQNCLFPYFITNPRCCAGYASGGKKEVIVPKSVLLHYYNEDFESTIITARGEKPDILKEI